jgi:hypothetical protein
MTKPVDDMPVCWCGRCARRFRGFGTLCVACSEIEQRDRDRAAADQRIGAKLAGPPVGPRPNAGRRA